MKCSTFSQVKWITTQMPSWYGQCLLQKNETSKALIITERGIKRDKTIR